MNDFDSKKLDDLLANGQLTEAKVYIEAIFAGTDDTNVKADAAIDYTLAYIKVANRIHADYLKSLQNIADLLQKTQIAEGKVGDAFKLAKVKSELNIGK